MRKDDGSHVLRAEVKSFHMRVTEQKRLKQRSRLCDQYMKDMIRIRLYLAHFAQMTRHPSLPLRLNDSSILVTHIASLMAV